MIVMFTGILEQIISYLPSKSLLYQTLIFSESRRLESCQIALVTFLIRYHYWRTFTAFKLVLAFCLFFFPARLLTDLHNKAKLTAVPSMSENPTYHNFCQLWGNKGENVFKNRHIYFKSIFFWLSSKAMALLFL